MDQPSDLGALETQQLGQWLSSAHLVTEVVGLMPTGSHEEVKNVFLDL